jgi:hypothetical protein
VPRAADGQTADLQRAQYEQMREQILKRVQTASESDLMQQKGMRSWIEATAPRPAARPASVARQNVDTSWKPIIPIVASLLVKLVERKANVPDHT